MSFQREDLCAAISSSYSHYHQDQTTLFFVWTWPLIGYILCVIGKEDQEIPPRCPRNPVVLQHGDLFFCIVLYVLQIPVNFTLTFLQYPCMTISWSSSPHFLLIWLTLKCLRVVFVILQWQFDAAPVDPFLDLNSYARLFINFTLAVSSAVPIYGFQVL